MVFGAGALKRGRVSLNLAVWWRTHFAGLWSIHARHGGLCIKQSFDVAAKQTRPVLPRLFFFIEWRPRLSHDIIIIKLVRSVLIRV